MPLASTLTVQINAKIKFAVLCHFVRANVPHRGLCTRTLPCGSIRCCQAPLHRSHRIPPHSCLAISPKKTLRSLLHEPTIGSVGWKSTSLTEPTCPGSLYRILRVVVSHTYTKRSADPDVILRPSGAQLHRSRFFSKLCTAPPKVLMQRSLGANGRTSQMRIELSIALDIRYEPSGLRRREVTVSPCPSSLNATSVLRRSQAVITLSMPPVKSNWSSADRAHAVCWYLAW